MAGRRQLECAPEARLGTREIERERPITREREVANRAVLQCRIGARARCLLQFERRQVVMGEHVGEIVGAFARPPFDPCGRRAVLGCPHRAGNLLVADVADQRVPEAVLVLTLHCGHAHRADELLPRQLVQRLLELVQVATAHRGDCAGPEHLADHGGVLQECLPVGAQRVETGGDQRLQRLRQLQLVRHREQVAVGEQPDELLRVERVPAGVLEERPLERLGQDGPFEQQREQLHRLPVRERRQVDALGVAGVAPEMRMSLVELRSRGAEHEQRHVLGPVREVLEERQQRVVGPVEILDDEDAGTVRGQELAEPAPRSERLVLCCGCAWDADERADPREQPVAVVDLGRHGPVELGGSLRGAVRLEDAGVGLDDLAEGPERDAVSVRQTAPLAPAHQARALLDVGEQLAAEAALADAGLADDRDQLTRALAGSALEAGDQRRLVGVPADQRGGERAGDVGSEPRPRLKRLPEEQRLRLALDRNPLERREIEHAVGRSKGRLRDRHGVDRRGGLHAGRGIHDVAGDERLAELGPRLQRDHRFPGVHADPHLQRRLRVLLVQLRDLFEDPEPGAHGPLGVVLVRDRRTEHRHHRVADELLDRAAMAFEHGAHAVVIRTKPRPHVLRVGLLGRRGEADQVAEEHGHDLPLLVRSFGCPR